MGSISGPITAQIFSEMHGLAFKISKICRGNTPGPTLQEKATPSHTQPPAHRLAVCVGVVQWRSKVGVGPSAKIPEGSPHSPYRVCPQCKQAIPKFWQFLGRPKRPKVCHTSKSQISRNFRRNQPTTADLCYTLFKKNLFFNKQNV